ncbi:hypothetical protein ACIPWF_04540 [Paenarthrobacter sp. NPDC089989]|uniref:hypothetical protein n=1 Tax=unclassified Paenarthrobacter TaxID=2634190 RepID=UPI003822087B
MLISNAACSSVMTSSFSRRSKGTSTGSIGANSFPAGARSTAQHLTRAGNSSGPYTGDLPGLGLTIFNTKAPRNAALA